MLLKIEVNEIEDKKVSHAFILLFFRNFAELKDFVTSMKEVASGKPAEKVVVEEKAAEVFTITLDVDNYKDTVKEGKYNGDSSTRIPHY